jgi:predicted DNA-binding protein (UPF0251 family)
VTALAAAPPAPAARAALTAPGSREDQSGNPTAPSLPRPAWPRRRRRPDPGEAAGLYEAGHSIGECARRLGAGYDATARVLREAGVAIRPPGPPPAPGPDPAEAALLYEAGHSLEGCARKLGVSVHILTRALRENGVAIRPPRPARPPVTAADAAALYEAGHTLDGCARELGVSRATVARLLRAAGVKIRPPGPRPPDQAAAIRLYEAGHTLHSCAGQLGTSRTTIARLLHAAGVSLRPPGSRRARPGPGPAETAALYQAGHTLDDCARELRVSRAAVIRALGDAGVPVRPAGPRRTRPDPGQATALYQAGHSLEDCARQLGTSPATLRRTLADARVTIRPPGRHAPAHGPPQANPRASP